MKKIGLGLVLTAMAVAAMPVLAQSPAVHVPVPGGWTAVDQEYRYGREDLWE